MIASLENYSRLTEEAMDLNRKIIETTGNWNSNMALAEKLYFNLMQDGIN